MTVLQVHSGAQTQTFWTATIKRLLDRYSEHRKKRRALAELRSVDPRTLKDMGIDRSEVTSIVYGNPKGRRRACAEGDMPPTHVDLNSGHCGTPASRRSVMTVRNGSRPIARVFRATAAPGCRDELLQRFRSSSAALVNSKTASPAAARARQAATWTPHRRQA